MKALIVNRYGENPKAPGGRRTNFWINTLAQRGFSCEVVHSTSNSASQIVRLFRRLINLTSLRIVLPEFRWIKQLEGKIKLSEYQLIVLCVPGYEVLELLNQKKDGVTYLVDLRDGVFYESLYSKFEKFILKTLLEKYEYNLNNADILTSNVPGLCKHYSNQLNKKLILIYGIENKRDTIKTRANNNRVNLVYTGGLLRSSRGQHIYSLCKAIDIYNSSKPFFSLTLIGRFNLMERWAYRNIKIINEIPLIELESAIKQYHGLVIVNTTDRDLLPSKFWLYIKTDAPIISIGSSYSMIHASSGVPGVFHVSNKETDIFNLISKMDWSKKYDRTNINFEDGTHTLNMGNIYLSKAPF